jgi:hypothetical protein
MKVAILAVAAVVLVLAHEGNGATIQKRDWVAPWVKPTLWGIDLAMKVLPHSDRLQAAIHELITAIGTMPFSVDKVLSAGFNVMAEAINYLRGDSQDPTAMAISKLMVDLSTLVSDAVHFRVTVLGTDAGIVVCDVEAIFGITDCDLSPVSGAIDKLVKDATSLSVPTVLVDDSFDIAIAAVEHSAKKGYVKPGVSNALIKVLEDTNELFEDCLKVKISALTGDINAVVKDTIALLQAVIKRN